jgi:hypothetical protein
MMEMTMATIGLRMKKFATAYFPFLSCGALSIGAFVSADAVACGFSALAFT